MINFETFEPPHTVTPGNIIYWSNSLRDLQGVTEGTAIKTKALRFLKEDLVQYDRNIKKFLVNPIIGYNKTTYTVNNRGDNHWQCNCQFYNKVSYKWEHPICSHIQAVKLWLEINRWNS